MGRSLSGRRSTVLKIGDSHPDVRAAAASLAVMAAETGFGDRGRRRRVGAPVQPLEPGILHPSAAARRFAYERHVPDVRLQPYVENFWTITWDLRGQDPYVAQVLPYPSVNASVTSEQADVTGVQRRRYERRLTGLGYVVGARFRPGCFRPFLRGPVSDLTDRARPIAEVLGRDTRRLQQEVAAAPDRQRRVTLLTDFLLAEHPRRDPVAEWLAELVGEIAADAGIIRVDQVAALARTSVRRLQRLFAEYVGAGPKWVITRCRLQDAAARAATDLAPDWAALAVELGFADQAHLTRAFSQTIGLPPASYAAAVRAVPVLSQAVGQSRESVST
jgi:AraC-like DNA-binding protein